MNWTIEVLMTTAQEQALRTSGARMDHKEQRGGPKAEEAVVRAAVSQKN